MKAYMILIVAGFSLSSFASSYGSYSLDEVFSRGYSVTATVAKKEGSLIRPHEQGSFLGENCKIVLKDVSENLRILKKGRTFELKSYKSDDYTVSAPNPCEGMAPNICWEEELRRKEFVHERTQFLINDKSIDYLVAEKISGNSTVSDLSKACNLKIKVVPVTPQEI